MAPVPGFSSLGKLRDDYDCFNGILEVLGFALAVASRTQNITTVSFTRKTA